MANKDVVVDLSDRRDRGQWILTFTGKQFFLTDPKPEEVCLEDIAHALANIGRFTGHAARFYSVAEHSLGVARQCQGAVAAWALLHDAAEAYVGDVSRPLKRSAEMEAYHGIENRILLAIFKRFGLHAGGSEAWIPDAVKDADLRMLMTEKRDLMPASDHAWSDVAEPYGIQISLAPYSNEFWEAEFLKTARALGIS